MNSTDLTFALPARMADELSAQKEALRKVAGSHMISLKDVTLYQEKPITINEFVEVRQEPIPASAFELPPGAHKKPTGSPHAHS